jgi:hypothetical protein
MSKKPITIKGPWTYRTSQITIEYGPGLHEVSEEIALAFKGESDGDGLATIAAPGDTDAPEI